jgi:hypothetical protein
MNIKHRGTDCHTKQLVVLCLWDTSASEGTASEKF